MDDRKGYVSGLFGCLDDVLLCLVGTLAPCYLAAWTIRTTQGDDGCDLVWCMVGGAPLLCGSFCCLCGECWVARSAVHGAYDLHQDVCPRIIMCIFCAPCMLCQDAREVKARHRARPTSEAAPLLAAPSLNTPQQARTAMTSARPNSAGPGPAVPPRYSTPTTVPPLPVAAMTS